MKIYLFYTTSNLVFPNPPNSIVSGGILEPTCARLQEPIVLEILQVNVKHNHY